MNVKAVVAVFNHKKVLVGAFSIIVKLQTLRRFVCSSTGYSAANDGELDRGISQYLNLSPRVTS